MAPATFCSCVFSKLHATCQRAGTNLLPNVCLQHDFCLTTGSMVNKRKRKGGNQASGNRSKISQNIDKGLPLMELTQPTLDDEHKAQVWDLFQCLAPHVMISPDVRKSKTVLDSGSHFMDSGFFVSGTWIQIPNISGILDSLSCNLDSRAQDSASQNSHFPDSAIRIPLHQG